MTVKKPENVESKAVDAGVEQLFTERNRYFTGKYMTARDFRDEQRYFLSHHRWHQWSFHGWGIVWGLQVKVVDDHCLRIEPGMAIDCRGRELVLPYAVQFAISELPDLKDAGEQPDGILIGLRFDTILRDPVPLLLDDRNECSEPAKDTHNRIDEFARICWQEYSGECWQFPPVYLPVHLPRPVANRPRTDQKGEAADEALSLKKHHNPDERNRSLPPIEMKPPCECGACAFVPLARLCDVNGSWKADDLGCRYVQSPFYGEALAHIIGINWNHGEETSFQSLCNDFKIPVNSEAVQKFAQETLGNCQNFMGRIIIEFDRSLGLAWIENQGPAALSTYFGQLLRLEYVELDRRGDHDLDGDDPATPLSPKHFHLSQCRTKLYCDFPAHRVNHDLPVRMRLALNCDMIPDDRRRSVDGDHLGGQVPNLYEKDKQKDKTFGRSGNGVEGGVFYSWTKLTPSSK